MLEADVLWIVMDIQLKKIQNQISQLVSMIYADMRLRYQVRPLGMMRLLLFLTKKFVELSVEIDKIVSKRSSILSQQDNNETNANVENDVLQGLKKKEGVSV